MSSKKIIGAIFPLPYRYAIRLLRDKKQIFVKFTRFKQLNIGSKIIFYVSGEKILIGEGRVASLEGLDTETTWIRYSKQMFLTKEEYDNYVKISPISQTERPASRITVFALDNLKAYRKPLQTTHPVTPSGRYVTNEEYKIMKNVWSSKSQTERR